MFCFRKPSSRDAWKSAVLPLCLAAMLTLQNDGCALGNQASYHSTKLRVLSYPMSFPFVRRRIRLRSNFVTWNIWKVYLCSQRLVHLKFSYVHLRMDSTKELILRVKELEKELELARQKYEPSQPARERIVQMSSEVVDSNPYRYGLRNYQMEFCKI